MNTECWYRPDIEDFFFGFYLVNKLWIIEIIDENYFQFAKLLV